MGLDFPGAKLEKGNVLKLERQALRRDPMKGGQVGVSVGSGSQSQLGLKGGTSCFAHLPSLLFLSNRVEAWRVLLLHSGRVTGLRNPSP
jgi:hypothetical protein